MRPLKSKAHVGGSAGAISHRTALLLLILSNLGRSKSPIFKCYHSEVTELVIGTSYIFLCTPSGLDPTAVEFAAQNSYESIGKLDFVRSLLAGSSSSSSSLPPPQLSSPVEPQIHPLQ